jgi:predicted RNA-binding protein with PUA-like domain
MLPLHQQPRSSDVQYWLLKSEPDTWSWDDQVSRGDAGEIWDGVRNHQAANFLRSMQRGDHAFFYHSGKQRSIVGEVDIVEPAFPDPSDASGKFVAVRVRALRPLPRSVTLAELRAETSLADLLLLRHTRLSVSPITPAQWRTIQKLASRG